MISRPLSQPQHAEILPRKQTLSDTPKNTVDALHARSTPEVVPISSVPNQNQLEERYPTLQPKTISRVDLQSIQENLPRSAPPEMKPKASEQLRKPIAAAPGDRALERKDYIAKMLAAKATKTSVTKAAKQMEATSPLIEEHALNSAVKNSDNGAATSIFTSTSAPTKDLLLNLEAKKKAMTELLRRKTEALMNRSKDLETPAAKDSQHPPAGILLSKNIEFDASVIRPVNSLPLQEDKMTAENTLEILQQNIELLSQVETSTSEQYTPSTPFFVPLERKSTSGIPGLSVPLTIAPISVQQLRSTALSSIVQNTRLADPLHEPSLSTSITVSQTTPKLSTDTKKDESTAGPPSQMTDISSIAVRPDPGRIVESRKRAIASDFIDVPIDRTKRRVSSNNPISLLIEVSDDEDMTDVEEINFRSVPPAIAQRFGSVASGMVNKTKSIRALPPLRDLTTTPNAPVSSTISTPPLYSNLNQTIEPRELAQREREIQKLRQKIAESELRKKAKRTAGDILNPGASLPSLLSTRSHCASAPVDPGEPRREAQRRSSAPNTGQNHSVVMKESLVDIRNPAHESLSLKRQEEAKADSKADGQRNEDDFTDATQSEESPKDAEVIKTAEAAEANYRKARTVTLEVALPELEAQIVKAESRLLELRQQKGELEAEIKRGSDGKQMILEELENLRKSSIVNIAEELNTVQVQDNLSENQTPDNLQTSGSISSPYYSNSCILMVASLANKLDLHLTKVDQFPPIPTSTRSPILLPAVLEPSKDESSLLRSINGFHFPTRVEGAEDLMEISSASADEDRSCESITHIPANVEVRASLAQSQEEYEPSLEFEAHQQQHFRTAPDQNSTDIEMRDPESLENVPVTLLSESTIGHVLKSAGTSQRLSEDISMKEEGLWSHSMSDDHSDSDVYEPPEPPEPILMADNAVASKASEILTSQPPSPSLSSLPQAQENLELTPATSLPVFSLSKDVITADADQGKTNEVGYLSSFLRLLTLDRFPKLLTADLSANSHSMTVP